MVLLRTCSSKAPVLFVVPGSNRIFQEGNLLVTGVNTFCIFNPRKCLQMGSCHPGKWVCDLYPPLAESEWWKLQTPPGGPAARLGVGLWNKAFICPAGATSALSSKKPAESWCRNSLERLAENVVILIWIQRSKVLRLPFSVFSFLTWRALLTFLKAKKKKKMPWVDGVCQPPANSVSRLVQFVEKLQRAQVQTRLSYFFFSFSGSCQYSRERPQKIRDVQEAREVVRKKNSSESLRRPKSCRPLTLC